MPLSLLLLLLLLRCPREREKKRKREPFSIGTVIKKEAATGNGEVESRSLSAAGWFAPRLIYDRDALCDGRYRLYKRAKNEM